MVAAARKTARKERIEGVTPDARGAKALIERAALALFCAKGVDAVTTREISAASGVSEGALYRHYPSKEALAQTMFFAIHARLAEEVARAARSADDIDDKARAIVGAYAAIADADWTLFSYHLLTTHRFLPYAEKSSRAKAPSANALNPVAIVEDVIAGAMKRGYIPKGDAALKAAAALGVVLQSALHRIYGRVTGPMKTHEDALSRAVVAVLKS